MHLLLIVSLALSSTVCFVTAGNATWQQYVRAPSSSIVRPKAILSQNGSVTNARALLSSNGVATFSRNATFDTIPEVLLDFGQNIVGYPQISFSGASSNSPGIRLTFSETLEYLTNISDFTRSDNGDTITPGTDQYAVPAQPANWTDTNGCLYNTTGVGQVCADGLHGFRYMRIALDALASDAPYTQPNGTFSISSLNLNFTAFLGTPETFTGWFECSDSALTQYWFDAAYTNEMVTDHFRAADVDPRDSDSPTLEGKLVLFDGAKRDRDPYVGDIAVSGLSAYLTHNISEAAKNVIGDLADHQRSDGWIPPASIDNYTLPLFDYPLWWAVTSWQYVLYTGDLDYATTYLANLEKVLDGWYPSVTDSNGLLSKGLNGTSGYGDYAFLPRTDEVTYYNALYVYALKLAAQWATALNSTGDAQRWINRSSTVSDAINAHLWDPAVGAYLDSSNTTTGVRHAQDGNGIAILAGVANDSYALSALNYLSTHTAQPYGNAFYDVPVPTVDNATERVYAFISFFELQARFLANQADSALEQISRLYGWMTTHDPNITLWEGIGPGGMPYEEGYTSMAHGWSTGVLPLLSNYVLGVQPTGPGFSTWALKPYTGGLDWARGQVSTPNGAIEVSWQAGGGGEFEINATVPAGTEATIAVPASNNATVCLDGQMVYAGGLQGYGSTAKYADGFVELGGVKAGDHRMDVSWR